MENKYLTDIIILFIIAEFFMVAKIVNDLIKNNPTNTIELIALTGMTIILEILVNKKIKSK